MLLSIRATGNTSFDATMPLLGSQSLLARSGAGLAKTRWVALGSLVERGEPGLSRPRFRGSRRVEGKTVTVALSKVQFEWLKEAIQNQRDALDVLSEMHQLTLDYMWKTIPNNSRRKRLTKRTLGFN